MPLRVEHGWLKFVSEQLDDGRTLNRHARQSPTLNAGILEHCRNPS